MNGGSVGVVASGGTANPTFMNCAFSGNSTTGMGGGLYFGPTKAGSINAVLTNCSFTNNSASTPTSALARGGGLAAYSFGAGNSLFVTINGGIFVNNSSESFGGGLLNYARGGGISQVTVNGTVFSGNAAASGGGASLYYPGGQGLLTFNGATFDNNSASQNGGAANSYCELNASLGNLVFEGCLFTDNLAGSAGGTISNSAQKSAVSNAMVSRCRFENNSAAARGGGVYALSTTNVAALPATSTTTNVTNSVFVGNNGGLRGGALYNESALGSLSNLQVTHLTVVGNTAQNGAALFNTAPGALSATASATNSIFWANTCTDTTSRYFHGVGIGCGVSLQNCVLPLASFTSNEVGTGSFTDLGGNISNSPQFVNLALGDLHLQAGSPCIDAGTAMALTVDLDGNARPQGNGFDMGAYESAGNRPMARQPLATAAVELTATVYPNPTTGAFTLSFDREVTGFVQIFDAQGRLVETLHATSLLNGANQTSFDLGTVSTGMYLVRIVDGGTVTTKSIVVARP